MIVPLLTLTATTRWMALTSHVSATATRSIHGGVVARTIAFPIEKQAGHNAKVITIAV